MSPSFTKLPRSVRDHARTARLGRAGAPALLAHPDWMTPSPVCVWLHGRTVSKEMDPGRYARWLKAGIAVCAIDLPGHGERANPPRHGPECTLEVIAQAVLEIDSIVESLGSPKYNDAFDLSRVALGGMSMGGMIALRRLCEPHKFVCAAVEATSGNLKDLYFPRPDDETKPWPVDHDPAVVAELDPSEHLDAPGGGFEPLPLLVLHSESDEMVPWRVQERFLARLREHFAARGVSEELIEVQTWPETGAPGEHVGFGRMSNDAKNMQTTFLKRCFFGSGR